MRRLVLLPHLLLVSSALLISADGGLHGKRVYVRDVSLKDDVERRSEEEKSLPHLIPIKLETGDGQEATRLLLQRNTRIPADIPVTFDKAEFNERAIPSLKDTGFYHDYGTGAAVTVDNNGAFRTYQGFFQHENELYAIKPEEHPTGGQRQIDDGAHLVEKISSEGILSYGHDTPTYRGAVHEQHSSTRARKLSGSNYEVELLMYLDYTIYEFWTQFLGDHDKAVEQIKKEFTSHINAMDLSYELIGRDGYGINVRIIPWGLHIITSETMSPWTTQTLIDYKDPYYGHRDAVINADSALRMMTPTIYQIGAASGHYPDHLMLWTQHDLGGPTVDDTGLLGLAFPGGVCSFSKSQKDGSAVSIIEDIGQMAWKTATHELGHSLGMYHDDIAQEGCGNDYIMSSALLVPDKQDLNLRFSDCSVKRMTEVFTGTGRAQGDDPKTCLQETDCSMRVYISGGDYKFGEQWTRDQYCQMYNDKDYKACEAKNADKLCEVLACYREDLGPGSSCSSSTRMWTIPGDGTPCDDGKWCIKGRCVEKSKTEEHKSDARSTVLVEILAILSDLNDVKCSDGSTPDKSHQDNDLGCYDNRDCNDVNVDHCAEEGIKEACCSTCKVLMQK